MQFYIIIVTFNAMQWLPKCLESTKPYSVIVVDNNSTDGTVDFIEQNYPEIILLQQKENLGFGQANNIGISYALKKEVDFVFLMNQDAYLEEDSLEELVSIHKYFPEFGILSPIHLNGLGNLLDENFSYYLSYRNNKSFYSDFVLNKTKKEIYNVPFVNAAGWLISRKCLETVGGFDPIFFHYGEDVNYCQRINYHKLKVGVVPGVYMKHDRETRKDLSGISGTAVEWINKARSYKMDYADINKEHFSQLENALKNRKKSYFKSYIKLNFKSAAKYKMEIKILENVIPEIKRSRHLNKQLGANYLSV